MHPPGRAIDEALWAAYRRDDKAAVMDYLFRGLAGIGWSRSFSGLSDQRRLEKGRTAKTAHGGPWLIMAVRARFRYGLR